MQRPVPYGLPEEYRGEGQNARIRGRGLEGGGYPPWYENGMEYRYYPGEYYQYPNQRFEQSGLTVDSVREPRFSNGSDKWDRSNGEWRNVGGEQIQNLPAQTGKREVDNVPVEGEGRKQMRLDNGQGLSQQRVPSHQVAQLSVKDVESGVRVTKEPKDGGGLSVFHITGKDSIWSKIGILNEKKLCYECQREKWRDKITPLCKDCYKKLSNSSGGSGSRKECTYCRIEFLQHRILKKAFKVFNKEICMDCCKNLCKHNSAPLRCHFCDCWSAWNSHLLCDRCSSSREQFGEPFPCDMCRKTCAFDRGEEARKKLDGRMFCFLCTFKYKRLKHEEVKKTQSEYKKAEEALTKVGLQEINPSGPQNGDRKAAIDPKGSVDWMTVAQERTLLYEKAKQDLAELKAKELSNRIEAGSLITQLKEMSQNLEKQNRCLEDKVLKLNAEINDWQLKLDNICEEKNKQIKLLKDEKRQALQEMEGLIEKLEEENRHLRERVNASLNS